MATERDTYRLAFGGAARCKVGIGEVGDVIAIAFDVGVERLDRFVEARPPNIHPGDQIIATRTGNTFLLRQGLKFAKRYIAPFNLYAGHLGERFALFAEQIKLGGGLATDQKFEFCARVGLAGF